MFHQIYLSIGIGSPDAIFKDLVSITSFSSITTHEHIALLLLSLIYEGRWSGGQLQPFNHISS